MQEESEKMTEKLEFLEHEKFIQNSERIPHSHTKNSLSLYVEIYSMRSMECFEKFSCKHCKKTIIDQLSMEDHTRRCKKKKHLHQKLIEYQRNLLAIPCIAKF